MSIDEKKLEEIKTRATAVRMSDCSLCGDSTYDHYCNDKPLPPSQGQQDVQDLLAEIEGRKPLMDFRTWYQQHVVWSERTFGPASERGPEGPVDHLRKEIEELAQDPKDLEEVSDCIHLAADANWRSGHTFDDLQEEIYQSVLGFKPRVEFDGDLIEIHLRKTVEELGKFPRRADLIARALCLAATVACRQGHSLTALLEMLFKKQAKNIARKWPDWRTAPKGKAIEHVRELDSKDVPVNTLEGK